jgi:ABC-type methionine transport system permease subunit
MWSNHGTHFRTIYYMLNNVVNLVKCVVFILLVVVMFNQKEFWSLPVTMF